MNLDRLKTEAKSNRYATPRQLIRNVYSESTDPKLVAMEPSDDAKLQRINRARVLLPENQITGNSLSTLVIPAALKVSKNGDTFLWVDSDKEDRILMFSTTENFKLLKQYRHWMVDGTFDICPTLFSQLE